METFSEKTPAPATHRPQAAGRRALSVLGALLCLLAPAAWAANPAPEQLLVLAVTRESRMDLTLVKALSDHLAHSGEALVEKPRLTSADRRCIAPECLNEVAARTQATLILLAQIKEVNDETSRVRMWLYDPRTSQGEEDQRVCAPTQVESFLKDQVAALLQGHRAPSAPAQSVSEAPVATALVTTASPPRASRSPRRRALAGALGGAAALALTTAITLTALNHSAAAGTCPTGAVNSLKSPCAWDFTAGYGAGYATTLALVLGVGLTLGLP